MIKALDFAHILRALFIGLLSYVVYICLCIIFPPINFPKNIPTIPFYVSFLSSYTSFDQLQIYNLFLRAKLEKHGAVKVYFASRWNILVTRPEYLVEIFKKENVYAKSGNDVKIPDSVLAQYTGNNIISAHGEDWKLYRNIVGSSIQFPDTSSLARNTQKFIEIIKEQRERDAGRPIQVTDSLQRYSLQNVGDSVLGINFELFGNHSSPLSSQIKYVKSQIFKPFFLNFPYFDKFPIPSRLKAKEEVSKFRSNFCNLIKSKRNSNPGSATNRLVEAQESGRITSKQFTDNAIILMVAGHENPLLLMLSLLYVLTKYPTIQEDIRQDLAKYEDPEKCHSLNALIYETLRLFPPLGQIINRKTTSAVTLGKDINIPKGVYVGYNNLGTGRDSTVWGKDSDVFNPKRWGDSLEEVSKRYSDAKRNSTLPAFHGRKRACLGEKFALLEVKILVTGLLSNFRLKTDPDWVERLTPAGPICPLMLKVDFEDLDS